MHLVQDHCGLYIFESTKKIIFPQEVLCNIRIVKVERKGDKLCYFIIILFFVFVLILSDTIIYHNS